MVEIIVYFFVWTLILYWIHRIGHTVPILKKFHFDHHRLVLDKLRKNEKPTKWHWSNLFLFNDTWKSTVDLWITEVIPTLLFSLVTGQWWLSVFYYVWAAFIQEAIEHDPKFNWPLLTSGQWHLQHHVSSNKNYGLFFPVWDMVFDSHKPIS
jgi:sterol desaturase/sphingolipid hydroxylase (fatty acid hydroxylase superfamily)